MARTRAQEQAASEQKSDSKLQHKKRVGVRSNDIAKDETGSRKPTGSASGKRSPGEPQNSHQDDAEPEASKKRKISSASGSKSPSLSGKKVSVLLSKYGALPLQDVEPLDPSRPLPETLVAFVFNAMLSSTRISHQLAANSVACLIDAGYHDIHALKKSSWQERTEVLTKGGYTHYREKTATMLGDLADLVIDKYDGDLNNILKQTDSSPSKIRAALKEIKGIGDVGLDIFCDTAQGVWPELAPFMDPRSLQTASQIGLGGVEELWRAVNKDPLHMCKLASALVKVRLDNKVDEFTE